MDKELKYIQEENIAEEKIYGWDKLVIFYNKISSKLLFFYCVIFCILYVYFSRNLAKTIFFFSLFFIVATLYNNKHTDNVDQEKQIIYPKSKYIENNKEFTEFIFSIQEFYYYNQQLFIDMVSAIDNFLSVYDNININNSLAGELYNTMEKQKFIALDSLQHIVIIIPDNRKVIEKLNKSVEILEEMLNNYLNNVYNINKKYIKDNGYHNNTKLINRKLNYPYNETFNSNLKN
jgi:hypothetical protein